MINIITVINVICYLAQCHQNRKTTVLCFSMLIQFNSFAVLLSASLYVSKRGAY